MKAMKAINRSRIFTAMGVIGGLCCYGLAFGKSYVLQLISGILALIAFALADWADRREHADDPDE